jgi:hypothetical protein
MLDWTLPTAVKPKLNSSDAELLALADSAACFAPSLAIIELRFWAVHTAEAIR